MGGYTFVPTGTRVASDTPLPPPLFEPLDAAPKAAEAKRAQRKAPARKAAPKAGKGA